MKEKRPEVYVDMDGVLADFFAEYAKLAGIKSGNYRDIPPAKTDPTLNKMIGTDFFARLPKFTSADQLIKMVTKLYGSYHICSSPLRGDHENSEEQKKIWIKKHLSPAPASIIITPNKAKYAVQKDGTPNILIDDRGSNISAWEAKGGIGIKYQADEDGLEKIVDGIARARKILKGELEHVPQELQSKNLTTGKLVAKSGHNDSHDEETNEDISKNVPAYDVENYATWIVKMSKEPVTMGKITGNSKKFVAVAQHRKNKSLVYYGIGNSQGEARENAFDQIHSSNERSANIDDFKSFNVVLNTQFTREYYDKESGGYLKIDLMGGKPVLLMAKPHDYSKNSHELRKLGFRIIHDRDTTGESTRYNFNITHNEMKKLGLIPNMRYGLQQDHNDSHGNSVFIMVPDTRTLSKSDMKRMAGPGLTIGASEKDSIVDENGEINPRFQQNPIMAKESASSGGTSAGSVASAPAQGGGWLFGGTIGAPNSKKKKAKVLKR